MTSWLLCLLLLWFSPCSGLATIDHGSRQKCIPITILGGFLGSGKTTLLQNMLQNNQGLKIAVIVNDVASVNIDSKLVSGTNMAAGMVELQNGCACCSLSEELLSSVSELVTLSDIRRQASDDDDDRAAGGFDHIVVELSGVADPKGVRSKFQEAVLYDMPLMERVRLDTMVTLVDCGIFLEQLKSSRAASPDEAPELFYRDGEEPPPMEDWMKDVPEGLLEALQVGGVRRNPMEQDSGVAELLVAQVETADVLVLNKVDLVDSAEELEQIEQITQALNPRSSVLKTKFGEVPLDRVLGVAEGRGVVEAGVVDDHRDSVEAAEQLQGHHVHGEEDQRAELHNGHSHSHGHSQEAEHAQQSHSHGEESQHGDIQDSSHSHSHGHSQEVEHAQLQSHSHGEEETHHNDKHSSSHSHSHSHGHSGQGNHDDLESTGSSHSHSHEHSAHSGDQGHSHDHDHEDCADPDCTDPSHSHSHDHHAGIGSFVYRARRPFHPGRLTAFLSNLKISRGLSSSPESEEESDTSEILVSDAAKGAMENVLRSKGFVWCADSHEAAMFWSHAGSSFELSCVGRWWATLDRSQWPPEAVEAILQDFDDRNHDDEKEGMESASESSVGDRRQEVVFIGPRLGNGSSQRVICSTLDQCLLNDAEWSQYREKRSDEMILRSLFPNPLQARVMTY